MPIRRIIPRQIHRMEPLIIPIRDRSLKIAERMDLFGHGVAAFGLRTAAMDRLPGTTPAQTALGGKPRKCAGVHLHVASDGAKALDHAAQR